MGIKRRRRRIIKREMVNDLPLDVITNIFSRLPIDSIIQCKLVCKTWRSRLNDPDFINAHTRRLLLSSSNDDEDECVDVANFLLFVTKKIVTKRSVTDDNHDDDYEQLRLADYKEMHRLKVSKPINHGPMRDKKFFVASPPIWNIVGSSKGLICLSETHINRSHMYLYVFNPFTREYTNIPRFDRGRICLNKSMALGFGYHPRSNKFKLVRVIFDPSKRSGDVNVYTLGSGVWRNGGEIKHLRLYTSTLITYRKGFGILLNGCLHWLNDKREIVSFDLEDEKFRVVVPSSPYSPSCGYDLGVLGGCLSVIQSRGGPDYTIDVWVLMVNKDMDDQSSSSWIKKCSIKRRSYVERFKPLALLRSGEVVFLLLLQNSKVVKMVSYDLKTRRLSNIEPFENVLQIIPYTKSFVSLKDIGEDCSKRRR